MRPETKQPYFFGVSFLFAPPPALTPGLLLSFQQRLAEPEAGIVFDQVQRLPAGSAAVHVFTRAAPPLQVTVGQPGPQPLGQLLVVAPQPNRTADDFIDDAESVVEVFRETWPGPIQVIRRDCTVRHLYSVREEHAFRYLWAHRLRQPEDAMREFGRQILGGGLRLVMPARVDVENDPLLEVKIESLLADPRMLFVETQAVWEQPLPPGNEPNPRELVEAVEQYADGPVVQFIMRER